MTEHQLKLAKLYAELIGLTYVEYKGLILVSHGFSCDKPFNPFIGQLQIDARDNFYVSVSYCEEDGQLYAEINRAECVFRAESKGDVSTLVIECILKSKGRL